MFIVYFTAAVAIFILINKLYNSYYEKERKKLIKINKRKLQINDLASQKELMKIRNEKLQNDLENKNREVAIATMSTVKRNEFLNKIKNELKSIESHPKNFKINQNNKSEFEKK